MLRRSGGSWEAPDVGEQGQNGTFREVRASAGTADGCRLKADFRDPAVAAPRRRGGRNTGMSHSPDTRGMGGGGGGGRGAVFGDFLVLSELAAGSHSKVFHVKHKITRKEMAIKCYYRSSLSDAILELVREEIRIHSSVHHPDITEFYGWFEDEAAEGGNLYLMLELAKRGDVFNLIQTWSDMPDGSRSSEAHACRIVIRPLVSAVSSLHAWGIMHRDIKAENLLLTDDHLSVKLADFGFAVNFRQQRSMTRVGTLEYMVRAVQC